MGTLRSFSFLCVPVSMMMSQESGDAQAPHASPSPGHHQHEEEQEEQGEHLHDHAQADTPLPIVPADAHTSCRATRSSFPAAQNGESAADAKGSDSPASGDNKIYKGQWKDDWVASLIHLRGSMDEEFMKPQKSGLDLWMRVCIGMTEAHKDFDKNSESCRKKWQRIYKIYKETKALVALSNEEKEMQCRWYGLIDHYMHGHFDAHGNAISNDESMSAEGGAIHLKGEASVNGDHIAHLSQLNAKRARRDQEIRETLSKMVVTWRESLQVLKESEAKRLEILQKMNTTMAGLLDTLKK